MSFWKNNAFVDARPEFCHRLLAPRLAALVGTRGTRGADVAPISNVTQVSADPQIFVAAVFKKWVTYANIKEQGGFSLSIPRIEHDQIVWRLGEKFSGFEVPHDKTKLEASGGKFELELSKFGPVLSDATGWCDCELISEVSVDEGDHGVFLARVLGGKFNSKYMNADGTYRRNSRPLMQVVRNRFTTSSNFFDLAWLGKKHS